MPLSTFDADRVAAVELGWWQAHNEHDIPALRQGLEQQTQELYGVDSRQAATAVSSLLEATKFHDVRDWSGAIDACKDYFAAIKQPGDTFDPQQAAELEVGWWKLHDELEYEEDKSLLRDQFARLFAYLYGGDPETFQEAALARVEATREHDLAESTETRDEDMDRHWEQAEQRLRDQYRAIIEIIR